MASENLTNKHKMTSTDFTCTVGDPRDREIVLQCEMQTTCYGTGSLFVSWFAEGLTGTLEWLGEIYGPGLFYRLRRSIQEAYLNDAHV